jgi:hypothetical protein
LRKCAPLQWSKMSKQKKKIPANKPEQPKEVALNKIKFIGKLKELYPMSEPQIDQMAKDIETNSLITPVTLRDNGDGFYDLVHGQLRFTAYEKLERKNIPAEIIQCTAERAVTLGIIANGQRPKSWFTIANEIKYLLEQEPRELLPELRRESPTITRLYDGIAQRYGYNSKAFVYKMEEIIEADPILYVMKQLDTKELKHFEEAYRKATGKEEPKKAPKEKPFVCNCPLVDTCSKYAEWRRDQLEDETPALPLVYPGPSFSVVQSEEEGGNDE